MSSIWLFLGGVSGILAAFMFPLMWIVAGVCVLFSIATKKPFRDRGDGQPVTPGLFGWLIDDFAVKDCPYCLSKIPKNAKKCKHCGEWMPEPVRFRQGAVCPKCKTQKENDRQDICINCGYKFLK